MKILYTDGFTIGKNPSNIGGGYVIADEFGKEVERRTENKHNFTNNEAELLGILRATELVDSGGTIYTDSMNSMFWALKGKCKARPDLKPLAMLAKQNITLKEIKLEWIDREHNLAGIIIENK